MRDLLIFCIVFWGFSRIYSRSYVGIYLWTWVSLMNPHKLSWGFAFGFPFAQIIGAITLLSLITGKQVRLQIWSRETIVLAMYVIWVGITTVFAFNPEGAAFELNRFLKIQLFIFITLAYISDREKLNGFIWVIVLSLGYFAIKGGLFTIITGGGSRVWGPEGTFIGGNNEMALALLMVLPLMRYLHLHENNKWLRQGLLLAMLLCAIAILGSQSRGAFLGIATMGLFFWLKSKNKLIPLILVLFVSLMSLMFMPQTWWDRMNSIDNYQQDASAMGRINAWSVALEVANNRITGGGADMFMQTTFEKYAPNPLDVHDVHSIYFEVLGEQGYIGLVLWLMLALFTWGRCKQIIRISQNDPNKKWSSDLAGMVQVSMVGYATAGAFLGLSYFDLYYDLIAIALITWRLSQQPEGVVHASKKYA